MVLIHFSLFCRRMKEFVCQLFFFLIGKKVTGHVTFLTPAYFFNADTVQTKDFSKTRNFTFFNIF